MPRSVCRFSSLILLVLVSALPGCAKDKPASPSPPKTVNDFFPIQVGRNTVRMQLAVTPGEQEHGLMDRRDLGRDDGMLFVYSTPQQMHFWMHNTPTPLDIGFFNDHGVLLEVRAMRPFDDSTISSRSDRVKYPLEMNQGWFRENGVEPGAQLDLDALAAALKARGFDPETFGLGQAPRH